jgi:lipopolysaccharide export system protein LptA
MTNLARSWRHAVFLAAWAGLAAAQATVLNAQTVDTDSIKESATGPQNVNIEADSMEVLEAQKRAVFRGNVHAQRTGTKLISDRMVVTYIDVPQADGSKRTDVALIDAQGNVQIQTPRQTITGDNAILDVAGDLLTVTGNVVVREGSTVIRGSKLKADLKAKTSSMTGGRVRGSFVPKTTQ